MKPTEDDQAMNKSKDEKTNDDEKDKGVGLQDQQASTSKAGSSSSSEEKDDLFEPTVDMLVNDFDEEQTLEEEEALAAKDGHDPGEELSDLQRESEMPIEELLKLYGCAPPMASSSGSSSRKRRRRQEKSPQPPKQIKKQTENLPEAEATETVQKIDEEDSPDEDTATNTTNNLENTSLNDDETNFEEEEEPSELKKLYNADGELKLDATFSDEEDLDYVPEEEEGKKTIMVGQDYQAVIPEGLLKYDDALPYENEDKLLWDPSKISDNELEEYLSKISSATNGSVTNQTPSTQTTSQATTTTGKHPRDDEQALLLLLQCGNNSDEALRRRRLGSLQPTANTSIWSEEECRNFENGIKLFGKSFHEIQSSKVKTRSVGELVEFYYLWKKTERADSFANKSRLDKKKFTINQNASDIMDKYLEEYDGTNRERDRSISPNVNSQNSLLQTDMKRAHRSNDMQNVGNNNEHKVIKQERMNSIIDPKDQKNQSDENLPIQIDQ